MSDNYWSRTLYEDPWLARIRDSKPKSRREGENRAAHRKRLREEGEKPKDVKVNLSSLNSGAFRKG